MIAACIISSTFFWCTYRHQREPLEGRGSEDSLNAEITSQIQQEIYLTRVEDMLAEESKASEATAQKEAPEEAQEEAVVEIKEALIL
jgi:hypothetical protein